MNKKEKNKGVKGTIDYIKKASDEAIKLIEENNGGACLLIAVPNIDKEKYEKWQVGEGTESVDCLSVSCNTASLSILHNAMIARTEEIIENYPAINLLMLQASFKQNFVIDEEDLKNE